MWSWNVFIFSTKSVYYKLTYLGIPKNAWYFANGYISKNKRKLSYCKWLSSSICPYKYQGRIYKNCVFTFKAQKWCRNSKLFFFPLILILYNFAKFLSYCKLAYFLVFHNNWHIANGHTCQKYYNNWHIRKDINNFKRVYLLNMHKNENYQGAFNGEIPQST